jgi:hypothetical protein
MSIVMRMPQFNHMKVHEGCSYRPEQHNTGTTCEQRPSP